MVDKKQTFVERRPQGDFAVDLTGILDRAD